MKVRIALVLLLLTVSVAVAFQVRASNQPAAPASLTAYVPQDALLTIDSPDFSSLLHRWTNSAESRAWLASDNDAVFRNSRLFGRLDDAQAAFAKAAGIPAGVDLLNQLAGSQSVFAWYDIGRLEFLYITRMPAAQADRTRLLQARASFQRRHAGNVDFYIRTSPGDYGTVAFAEVPSPSGNLLLLATRQDLIANALSLIAANSPVTSVEQEPWFHEVSAALPPETPGPALHMVLNLDRIAFDPHFETYWIQRNITWTRQFRAAASDLYLESSRFREERVLLPRSPGSQPANISLASLAALPPPSTGVFRAVATRDPSVAVTAIQEKLLGTVALPAPDPEAAPDPDLGTPQSGSSADLETRIDAVPAASPSASTGSLARLLESAGLDAVLTLSSAQDPPQNGLWIPIHSAVILRTASPVAPQILASALQETLRGSLTAGNIGIGFQPVSPAAVPIFALSGPRPLFFAIRPASAQGNLVLLTDDRDLLSELLGNLASSSPEAAAAPATLIAAFNHSAQRASYLRLTSLIDGTNHPARDSRDISAPAPSAAAEVSSTPTFFSRNIGSLSTAFAALQSERVVERVEDSNLRQTVTYIWQTP